MAVADTPHDEHDHGHDGHGEFIAHHFHNAEQQFDSGKLGIWIFLVTEVLFFSGLFVAYTLYRSLHPEIFEQAHVFLDKILGGINTVVLLFSSLTMAWAVRSAQLGKNKECSILILITMVCATMFLGIKAVEYSHKWDMGILVRSQFALSYDHPEIKTGVGQALNISDYLVYLSVIPTILLVGFVGLAGVCLGTGKKHLGTFFGCMAITMGGYFLGAVGGQVYVSAKEGGHSANPPVILHAEEIQDAEKTHDKTGDMSEHAEDHSDGAHKEGEHKPHVASFHEPDPNKLDRDVGIFFSIYYCMTGLHAIHIIGGIVALAWLLWRSLLGHWRSDYFGPVDYVGLYWHLVDLIWIFLFPMLYLID